MIVESSRDRAAKQVRAWGISVEETRDTQDSTLVFGTRGAQAVVLKVIKRPGDEWRCGEVLEAFDGKGVDRNPLKGLSYSLSPERLKEDFECSRPRSG